MHILIVDDEALARRRLRNLLDDCQASDGKRYTSAEAAHAAQALELLQAPAATPVDVVLLDIHMPGHDGLALARHLAQLPQPPAVVFVTAHAEHAVSAFELDAVDYLTKPVRLQRLQQALAKVRRQQPSAPTLAPSASNPPASAPAVPTGDSAPPSLLIQDALRTQRLELDEVLYIKAEQKLLTLRTALRSYVLDGALSELEARYPGHFVRIHRNALVSLHALRGLERLPPQHPEGEGWAVRLHGLAELLPVSRRQLAAVRQALTGASAT